MKVAICRLNYYDSDKLLKKMTIKLSSSLNADNVFDKKGIFYGVLRALSSSIFLLITHASVSFFSVLCFI